MPFKPPVLEKCKNCGKAVYQAEERLAGGHKWHNFCFKCGLCGKMLDNTTANYSTKEEKVYCKVCYGKKLGPKGYGFGSGAGCLSTETGRQFGNKESDMSNKPTYQHVGASTATEEES
ncbi:muscle LIM protein 1-like [Watersipora subatra]|uniref:muscle LIM protein 1-like n=1 Tax=Watersipora subatra TaxID=2589382 RepID=UPI00355BE17C